MEQYSGLQLAVTVISDINVANIPEPLTQLHSPGNVDNLTLLLYEVQ